MMWSPARLLRWRTPDTLPWASVTPFAGLMLASPPGTTTRRRSTGAPTTGWPKAVRVTEKGTSCPGSAFALLGVRVRLTGPDTLGTGWNGTGPVEMIGPSDDGGMKLGAFPFVGEAEAPFVGMPVIGSMVGTPPGVFPGVFCPGVEFGVAGGTGSTWKAALIALAAPGTFTTMWSSPPLPAYLGIEGTTTAIVLSPQMVTGALTPAMLTEPFWEPKPLPVMPMVAPGAPSPGLSAARCMTVIPLGTVEGASFWGVTTRSPGAAEPVESPPGLGAMLSPPAPMPTVFVRMVAFLVEVA